ncbi:MAG TPA: hypothetical protein VES65_10695 [Solirubrobacteraceae bacterium]|nr:hypothetical protein [Solirubrobacteraceae bacterium]
MRRIPVDARRAAFTLCGVVALLFAAPGVADGDVFGPISLVSEGAVGGGAPQQAEYAHDAAVSGDGRYVAFDGSVGGVTGVWRRDLATGAIEQVAGGDAELPSISENGRYVSFTTNEGKSLAAITDDRPDQAPKPEAANVYVRNMSESPGEEGAFVVASAPSGSTQPLSYSGAGTTLGSAAAGRSAISADGNEVAFVTTAVSDLTDPEAPLKPTTPALQVAVRNLQTQETILVSGEYEPATGTTATGKPVLAVVGSETFGAVYPGNARGFRAPPAYGEWATNPPPGASISADGSTVAWMGEDIGRQAPMLAHESPSPLYTEPLWRRIVPGSQTPTMRVTGGSDPADPACAASGEGVVSTPPPPSDPCQGPFVVNPEGLGSQSFGIWPVQEGAGAFGDFVPRLSADGYEVAFLSGALPVALGENFGNHLSGEPSDLYVADMHPGLTRDQALTPLTELAGAESVADAEPISEFDISPDGRQVAFTTRRTQFPLGSPAYVSAPAAEPGMSELFDADLQDATLTRVTHGYEGGPSEQPHAPKRFGEEDAYGNQHSVGAQSPAFSADGTLLAFSSTASNLVLGDGNTPPAGSLDGSDAFLVARKVQGALPTPQYVSSPPEAGTEPVWQLGVTALSRSDGGVLLYVEVPGAGALRAAAQSAVLVSSAGASRARRAAAPRGHASRTPARKDRSRVTVVSRTVATASRVIPVGGGELVALVLRLGKRYATLASRQGGLSATVSLAFTAAGQPALRRSIDVTFLRIHPARSSHEGRTAARRHGGRP